MDFFLSIFTGWMSGMVFLPPWLNVGGFDIWKLGTFTNERAIEAEKLLIKEIGKLVAGSKVFLGFDLGNELNCLTRYEIDKDISKETVDNWSHIMFEVCNNVAPGKLHNNGMHMLRGLEMPLLQEKLLQMTEPLHRSMLGQRLQQRPANTVIRQLKRIDCPII